MSAPTERSWGVSPVPDRLRTLSFLDVSLLWGNLGISLLVLVAGALLVPALGLRSALLAILVGSLLGCALLGLAGMIGAQRGVPGMVLLRDPLGDRGSYAPTVLNVAQNLGWGIFELIVIATAASALADELFGFDERWVWVLGAGVFAGALALAGPISFVRRYVRRFAVWIVLASMAYLIWWTLDGADLSGLWSRPGEGGLTWWQGVDLTIAMAASWLPLAADYTRFARNGRAAFWGSALGYLVPLALLFSLGAILLLSRDLADPTAILAAIATGGVGAALALFALAVDENDEAFANIYSTAVSIQNLVPRAPQRLLIAGVAVAVTIGALLIDLVQYQSFLFLIGSFFVPLFGVLAADFALGAAPRTSIRWSGIAAWVVGFGVYQWLQPTGPEGWTSLLADHAAGGAVTVGASLPSFAAAFLVYAALRSAVVARPALGRR
jgi:putative hydroxymethylpyrimidine transporter CytX